MPAQATAHRVVVVGGGYAGTLAANRLHKRDDVDVTLLNPRPMFVDRIRLHQFVAGSGEATADYSSLLAEGIDLVVDSATRIDTAARTVRLASGRDLDYDYLIYAVGSTAATSWRYQFARKDDTAVNVYVSGRIAAANKELTCKLGLFKIRRDTHRPGSVPWPKGGPRPEQPVPNGVGSVTSS
jgi:NADPH-dependent 2,4-dienoyl-CoA reductase/sulfur reductase-like enzyme